MTKFWKPVSRGRWGTPPPDPQLTGHGKTALRDAIASLDLARDHLPAIHEVRELDGEAAELVLTALDSIDDAALTLKDVAHDYGVTV